MKSSCQFCQHEMSATVINKHKNGGDGSGNDDGENGSGCDDGVWIGFENASRDGPSLTQQRPPKQTENDTLYTHTHAHLAN